MVSIDDDIAGYFVKTVTRNAEDPLPRSYSMRINADANYTVQLGKNRLVCLDTQCDEGIVTTEISYLFRSGS